MLDSFQNAIVAYPMVTMLDRLLPQGVESLPVDLADALRDDDLEEAFELSDTWWNDAGPDDEAAGVTHGLMLTSFEEDEEALDVLRDARDAILGPTPALILATADVHLNLTNDTTAHDLIDEARESLAEHPDHARPPLWAAAGDLYGDLGEQSDALACYRKAIELGWEDFETAIRVGEMLKQSEAWEEAARAYEHAADLRADAMGPHEAAAECWREAGQMERALEIEAPIIRQQGADPDEWAKRGVAWRSVGRLERAVEAFDKATRMDPHDPAIWLELANTRLDAGEAEGALKAYEEVLSYESQLLEALEGATVAARQLGDFAAAEQYASRAVESEDATPEVWFHLGETRRQLGRLDEARQALEQAAELTPDKPEVHALLAEIHLEQDDQQAGRQAIDRAIELAPDNPDVQIQCAMALLKTRDPEALASFVTESSGTNARWRLVSPAFLVIGDAMQGDDNVQTLGEEFVRTAEELSSELPVKYDTSELRRYALVLESPHADVLEKIIRVLEDRDAPEAVLQVLD
jgi:tetratricopeptide (TPR) repeat protein